MTPGEALDQRTAAIERRLVKLETHFTGVARRICKLEEIAALDWEG